MKSLSNMSDKRWSIKSHIYPGSQQRVSITCAKCFCSWMGVVECCGEHMPSDLVQKRNMMNIIFTKYDIRA